MSDAPVLPEPAESPVSSPLDVPDTTTIDERAAIEAEAQLPLFDWRGIEANPIHRPTQVEHLDPDCNCIRSWRHKIGHMLCVQCYPPDPMTMEMHQITNNTGLVHHDH